MELVDTCSAPPSETPRGSDPLAPRTFAGYRPEPPTEYVAKGITNAGGAPDYEGVVFSDGTVAVRWLTEHRSVSVWQNFAEFEAVHGHPEYGTRIEWHRRATPRFAVSLSPGVQAMFRLLSAQCALTSVLEQVKPDSRARAHIEWAQGNIGRASQALAEEK